MSGCGVLREAWGRGFGGQPRPQNLSGASYGSLNLSGASYGSQGLPGGSEVSGTSHGSLNLDLGPFLALCATAWEVVALRLPAGVAARLWPLGAHASTPFPGGVLSASWLLAWLAVCTLGREAIVRCSWDPNVLWDPRCSSGPETLHRCLSGLGTLHLRPGGPSPLGWHGLIPRLPRYCEFWLGAAHTARIP